METTKGKYQINKSFDCVEVYQVSSNTVFARCPHSDNFNSIVSANYICEILNIGLSPADWQSQLEQHAKMKAALRAMLDVFEHGDFEFRPRAAKAVKLAREVIK